MLASSLVSDDENSILAEKKKYSNSEGYRRVFRQAFRMIKLVAKTIYIFFKQTPMVAAAAITSLAYGATPYVSYASCAVNAWK